MSIIAQWILAIFVIILISAVIMALIMTIIWYVKIKKIIKNIPKVVKSEGKDITFDELIKKEKITQKEVEDAKQITRRERQRRISDISSEGIIEQSNAVQSNSINEIRESGNGNGESQEGNKPNLRKSRKLPRI